MQKGKRILKSNPRVGLLNIGTEEKKGNELTKHTFEMLKEADFNFIGNVEARDLLRWCCRCCRDRWIYREYGVKNDRRNSISMFKMLKDNA